MKYFEIKFELYGHKMKTTLLAESETHAKNMIKNRILFHDVNQLDEKHFDNIMDFLAGFKNTKKR